MGLHGSITDAQLGGNFLARPALRNHDQDLLLPRRERGRRPSVMVSHVQHESASNYGVQMHLPSVRRCDRDCDVVDVAALENVAGRPASSAP